MEGIKNATEKMMMTNESKSVTENSKMERTQEIQTEKTKQGEQEVNIRTDRYTSSKEQEISGIYNVEMGKDGKIVIKYNDPQKQHTGDSVHLDSHLKTQRDSLKMKIKMETDDTKKKALKKKLKDIERQMKGSGNG